MAPSMHGGPTGTQDPEEMFMSTVLLRSLLVVMQLGCVAAASGRRWMSRTEVQLRRWLRQDGDHPATAQADAGQTTAEYGLVILAAGSLALAAILWARNSGSITGLFENVVDRLTGSL
jgi:Flp pilus assembly pilin Flp